MDMRALTQHARSDCVHDVQQAIREKTYLRKIQGHLRNATENRIDPSRASPVILRRIVFDRLD